MYCVGFTVGIMHRCVPIMSDLGGRMGHNMTIFFMCLLDILYNTLRLREAERLEAGE